MRILFASSEVAPYSKTGGLADVAGALPHALAARGHEVVVITPLYGSIDTSDFDLKRRRSRLTVSVGGKNVQAGILEDNRSPGFSVLFIEQADYFDRKGLYGNAHDFEDNDERYAFFSRAVLETCRSTGYSPDVVHCNDWQTGPVPALLQFEYRDRPELNGTGSVMTIHNLGYQGLFPPKSMMALGLGWNLFTPSNFEFYGKVSFLKAGLVFADKLTTVSPRYAKEIQSPAFGFGLDGLLRERKDDLRGILNGVDYETWDPSHDPLIAANYTFENLSGKVTCKADLQQEMGLPVERDLPLVGCISRLTPQKGLDLFLDASAEFLKLPCQWIFLGTGDSEIEKALRALSEQHPEKLVKRISHDEDLAHKIQAGSDLFMMPSRYEPCGLNQMYALRYGTIPIVRAVGGLDDTIEDISEGEGNGFKFASSKPGDLLATVTRAIDAYHDKANWRRLTEYAMSRDFSWGRPARLYEKLYEQVVALRI